MKEFAFIQNSFQLIGQPQLAEEENLWLGLSVDAHRLLYFIGKNSELKQIGNYTLHLQNTAQSLSDTLSAIFDADKNLATNFSHITLFLDGDFELIPQQFFKEEPDSFFNEIKSNEIVMSYSPNRALTTFFQSKFPDIKFCHSGAALIKNLSKIEKGGSYAFYVMVAADFIDIVAFDTENTLQFHNRYTYKTPNDFIYFVLLAADFLSIDRNNVALQLLGEISANSAIYNLCYRYFSKVTFLRTINQTTFGEAFNLFPKHIHFHFYSELSACAS